MNRQGFLRRLFVTPLLALIAPLVIEEKKNRKPYIVQGWDWSRGCMRMYYSANVDGEWRYVQEDEFGNKKYTKYTYARANERVFVKLPKSFVSIKVGGPQLTSKDLKIENL